MAANRLLHILSTDLLPNDEVLVRFADGSTAIFEPEELEKLRPRRKEFASERKIA